MSTFGWCIDNLHKNCRRSYEKMYFEKRGRTEVLVHTGEMVYCERSKRGCPCFVKAADRKKTKTTRRKK